ncbi:hypothetical protein [Paracoccus beibuensis]|uniref:hypothetical protein n=1 Tax=Paracoccus beibuensis TaxID=547602 RepID=UPI00223FD618|nr:hypothetical protein [Paracoccus beibuensis]
MRGVSAAQTPRPTRYQLRQGIVDLLSLLFLGKPLWMWLLFLSLVVASLVLDLGVLNKDDHEIGIAKASSCRPWISPFPASSTGRSEPKRRHNT